MIILHSNVITSMHLERLSILRREKERKGRGDCRGWGVVGGEGKENEKKICSFLFPFLFFFRRLDLDELD